MRHGMRSLALQVQQSFGRDPFAGDLYIFRGRRGDLCKIIWHYGVGMSLYAKRLERGKYIWPSAVDGVLAERVCAGRHGLDTLAVSYTHLTLPTICSV